VEVAGPGFLNLELSPRWFADTAADMRIAGRERAAGVAPRHEAVLLEYVSANPTGPPHVGHARNAAYGDSLSRILAFAGHRVSREYYVNDHGRQMRNFAASLAARYAQAAGHDVAVPEDGYRGEYVTRLAERLREEAGDRYVEAILAEGPEAPEAVAFFGGRGGALMLDEIIEDLAAFRTTFDDFFRESTLHHEGRVAAAIATLEAAGDAYRHDGAVWFRTSEYGDEKDRVLVRSSGEETYLASDVAYHLDKARRGHDRLVDVLGADHHGYIGRLRAVLAAEGEDPDRLEVQIVQLVSLLERGEAAKMSKRAGTIVTLRELVQDVGVDVARFFLVQRSHETAMELDLDLAREQSQENPVYYVQYAHARCSSILAELGAEEPTRAEPPAEVGADERRLTIRLAEWPTAVREASARRAPHGVAAYLIDLARDFHGFYHRCRVRGEEPRTLAYRRDLVTATRDTVATGLDLLGVAAPERM
jgi:arginyl-tRNA synthetase